VTLELAANERDLIARMINAPWNTNVKLEIGDNKDNQTFQIVKCQTRPQLPTNLILSQ